MSLVYDPTAPRGAQFTITTADGRTMRAVSQATALASLQAEGRSIRESQIAVAEAKLAAATEHCVARPN